MKFVDEAAIVVQAGNGGNGCLSFRREKYVEYGGPDGGNGGDGGSVVFVADSQINTLVDFRYIRQYKASNGEAGRGRNCTGAKGQDCIVRVPVGTSIIDADTNEEIIDLNQADQVFTVAVGGRGGLGNACFKSSTNRAPRQTKPGTPGDARNLRLQLKVLADVGLLGLPNAGKSTLVRSMSAAKPKVADYPFTTLVPSLGVVRVDSLRSFVMADIPGLIAGAADGAGLGTRFLRHLARNRVLLHLVDINPIDGSDPVANVRAIQSELHSFSSALEQVPTWLVCTKTDTLPAEEAASLVSKIVAELDWQGPVFSISAVNGEGLETLGFAVMEHLEAIDQRVAEDSVFAQLQEQRWQAIQSDLRIVRPRKKARIEDVVDDEDDFDDDDDHSVEIMYAP